MTNPPGADPFGSPHMNNHNEAQGGAYVGQQVGVQYGDTAFHDERVYHINQDDPPERKHEVALNFLAGGTPREAERLLGELMWKGHATTERAYYYFLSVISDRPFNDVNGEMLTGIVNARKVCASLVHDRWRDAFEVVWRLMRFMRYEVHGGSGDDDLQHVLDAFGGLPTERQDEIALHTSVILGGVARERLEAAHAHRVISERMKPNRVARAWKFFQPDPAQPRKHVPTASKAEKADVLRAVLGGLGVALGLLIMFSALSPAGLLFGLPLVTVGGFLVLRHGIAQEVRALLVTAKQREVIPPSQPVPVHSPGHWVSAKFVQEIHRLVDVRFAKERPHSAGDWPGYTEGIRAHLKERFVDLYGNAQVSPASVAWLISWHARRVATGWSTRALLRHHVSAKTSDTALFRVGIGVGALGLVALMGAGHAMAALLIGGGGFLAAKGIIRVKGLRGADNVLRVEASQLHAEELRGYHDWLAVLADRPTDAEMARWLALDKIYLKNDAVKRANLPSHDLVTHVVMTEGAKDAMRGRVLHGPPRYSKYVVQLFLLTRSGLREAQVELDFLTGEAKNERRELFRYDKIASASVTETGVRSTRGDGPQTMEVEQLRRRTFRLTLVNSQEITVMAENFRSRGDSNLDIEDESELFLAALQTSGIEAALPILEAVAAEGADWIVREQERRERWSREWYE